MVLEKTLNSNVVWVVNLESEDSVVFGDANNTKNGGRKLKPHESAKMSTGDFENLRQKITVVISALLQIQVVVVFYDLVAHCC